MAWENILVPIFDCQQSIITDFTGFKTNSSFSVSSSNIASPTWNKPSDCNFQIDWVWGDNQCGANMEVDTNTNYMALFAKLNGSQVIKQLFCRYDSTRNKTTYFMAIDEENQVGILGAINTDRSNLTWNAVSVTPSNNIYQVLKGYRPPVSPITSNGGGATHIAKRAGLLSSIGASNLSDILMVSGGGGGGLIIGEDTYAGKDAGGISGNGNNSANQTTGYAFGQGESDDGVSGGGGGLYGGYKGGT